MDMVLSSAGAIRHVLTWGTAAALIVSGVIFWSPSVQSLPGKLAVVLGDASYSAYLASALVIEFACRFLLKVGSQPSLAKEVLFQFLLVGFVFLAGWLRYRFAEQPMRLWLKAKMGAS
jgi:peptidoglycan/LPS O-acetylase OafA/YrhL